MVLRVADQASDDLLDIAINGAADFALSQSRRYVSQILDVFETLAAHPEIAPRRQGATKSVRLMPINAHHVLYVVGEGDVIILRVLHHLQDWFDLI